MQSNCPTARELIDWTRLEAWVTVTWHNRSDNVR